MTRDSKPFNRRNALKATGAVGTVGLAGLAGCIGGGDGGGDDDGGGSDGGGGDGGGDGDNYPVLGNFLIEGDVATFGFNVPQLGPYALEGENELRAYQPAVEHLNESGGWIDSQSDDLPGDGVLGYTIDYVDGDTVTDVDQARQSASEMIQRDDMIMISGGSSLAVAIVVQRLCQNEKVMFMYCLTHSNDTTGKDCVRYSFREMFNAYMTGQAPAPVVRDIYGEGLQFYQLYVDYSWGQTQQVSMERFMIDVASREQVESVATPLDTSNYSTYLSEAQSSGADVLILDHYGLDDANSMQQAIDAGVDGDMEIVVSLYNRLMAQAAGGAVKRAYDTVTWDSQVDNTPSQELMQALRDEYDRAPSGPAQLVYAQTLQHVVAVEHVDTLHPSEVIRQLEGYEYDNIGMGLKMMRGYDHRAQRGVPVVQGLPISEQSEGTYFNIVNITSRDDLGYACDAGPAVECELGSYGQTLPPPSS